MVGRETSIVGSRELHSDAPAGGGGLNCVHHGSHLINRRSCRCPPIERATAPSDELAFWRGRCPTSVSAAISMERRAEGGRAKKAPLPLLSQRIAND